MSWDSDGPIQVTATEAKSSWIWFLLLGLIQGGHTTAEDAIAKWPSVMVENRAGESRTIIKKLKSNDEAVAQAERVQAELDILGLSQWCQKYDVPIAWAIRESV
jgi:hypothetical protein